MAKYNVEQAALTGNSKIEYVISRVAYTSKKRKSWQKPLASIISKNFRCEAILLGGNDVAFFGIKTDAEAAKAVFEYLYKLIRKNSKVVQREVAEEHGGQHGESTSYVRGFLAGLQRKFDEQCTALMIVTPPEVTQKFHEEFRNLTPAKGRMANVTSGAAFQRGMVDGRAAMGGKALQA